MNNEGKVKLKIGVFFGGISSEKEVSLNSGRYAFQSIDISKYDRLAIYMNSNAEFYELPLKLILQNTTMDIDARLSEARRIEYEKLSEYVDFAFLVMHGKFGEDGCLQGLLELLKIPYSNAGVLGSALCMDKLLQGKILKHAGINDPESEAIPIYLYNWKDNIDKYLNIAKSKFVYPMIVKPNREGSSVGVYKVHNDKELVESIYNSFNYDNIVLIEEFLDGMEFSCIVMGNNNKVRALMPTEVVASHDIFNYEDKYMPGASQKITPPRTDIGTIKFIQEQAIKTHKELCLSGYSRVDGFVLHKNKKVFITDPNATSGMAPSSFIFHQAAEEDICAKDLITEIIENGIKAHKDKKGPL